MSFIYRSFSKESHGINHEDFIAPEAAKRYSRVTDYRARSWKPNAEMKNLLQRTLGWKEVDNNPFVFLTSSLLFAIQVALYRRAKGEQNIVICAIDIATARTPDKKPVQFRAVPAMMDECGLELNGRDYGEEFVAMDTIVLGRTSRVASLDLLISAGLYAFHAPLKQTDYASQRGRRPRLRLALVDMRKHGFAAVQKLSAEEMVLAAKIAACFAPMSQLNDWEGKVSTWLFAALLGFRKREKDDASLSKWLRSHSEVCSAGEQLNESAASIPSFERTGLVEVEQAHLIGEKIKGRAIRDDVLRLSTDNIFASAEQRFSMWVNWWRENRLVYRQENPRSEGDDERSSQSTDKHRRRKQHSKETRFASGKPRHGRHSRSWLPPAEYEAEMARKNARRAGRRRLERDRSHP